VENYHALLDKVLPEKDLQEIMGVFLDWQYDEYISKHLPTAYVEELNGIGEGATLRAGLPQTGLLVKRGITLASIAVGDVTNDIEWLIKDELKAAAAVAGDFEAAKAAVGRLLASGMTAKDIADAIANSRVVGLFQTCSMFGVWGSRTKNGQLFTGRNLDWEADTGVAKNKLVTVYHIAGEIPYASVSFSGVPGAITGMSAAGVTVHEAGDDSTNVTLSGFAWALRLRALMAEASNLREAVAFWKKTKNTMGINHGVGSAADAKFMALETRADYTAYFSDNDPREANFTYEGERYGFPLPEAIWRTNHAYDSGITSHRLPSPKPQGDTFNRYMLLHDTFEGYRTGGVAISDLQAVNLTAIVGDKGGSSRSSFLTCDHAAQGENIISATFVPSVHGDGVMYLAFENGHNTTHVPACCNNYVKIPMAQFFGSYGASN